MSVSLTLKNISRRYVKDNEEFMAVNNVNLEVKPGEFLTFLGPSGCGKTTTLRMIAGFETPTSGQILMDGVDINRLQLQCLFRGTPMFRPMNAAWALCSKTMPFSRT